MKSSPKALLREYRIALRILDAECPSPMCRDIIPTYRRRLLQRIAELEELSRNATPGHIWEEPSG
jgi:hypothetical protein